MLLNLLERLWPVKVLASSGEPDFQVGKIDHVVPSLMSWNSRRRVQLHRRKPPTYLNRLVCSSRGDGKRFPIVPLGTHSCTGKNEVGRTTGRGWRAPRQASRL